MLILFISGTKSCLNQNLTPGMSKEISHGVLHLLCTSYPGTKLITLIPCGIEGGLILDLLGPRNGNGGGLKCPMGGGGLI